MQATETDLDLATNDLGPLAWVLDELRKSLESASAALRRFVRDAGLARGQDMASVDAGQLRIARQQLHQAVGALEMVGLGAPALILRSMEGAVQKFVERPELCSEAAAAKVERAGFALTEYLEGVLLGKAASPVALFSQYKDVQELAGSDRIHPADLWPFDWRWTEPETPAVAQTLVYDPALRSRMDQAVLRIVKTGEAAAAQDLAACALGLAAGQETRQPRIFWKVAAGYFEALSKGLLPADVYVKRAASRVLLQYATLAKGDMGISDRLAQDLLFFCSQAVPPRPLDAPALAGVRAAYALQRFQPVDYSTSHYGRFDPVLLTQARKRITVAKETWSSVSGGDANKFKAVGEQFHAIGDSITKLHPASAPLAQALVTTVDHVVRAGQAPRPEVAMEVATAVLYLEAAFQDLDPTDSQLAVRTARLADRLEAVRGGGQGQPLEPWMEELYRRVSDRQTMGSVVGELRGTLSELEKLLDGFFRNPADKGPLKDAPTHLLQMRGVLSVLGLDQATHAVARMRDAVERILIGDYDKDPAQQQAAFDKLGNNLGALGFLIDMLNYQPALAKKLFVFDDVQGELRPLMGRSQEAAPDLPVEEEAPAIAFEMPAPAAPAVAAAPVAAPAPVVAPAPAPVAAPVAAEAPALPLSAPVVIQEDEADDELREIFLEEAREVVGNGRAAIEALAANPGDVSELTTLRRAFHTLKGSSRMVGLNDFGEAGWALEQLLNTWLADQKPASDELRTVSSEALNGFERWIENIATRTEGGWKSSMFRGPADALRTEGRVAPFNFPGTPGFVPSGMAPLVELPVAAEPAAVVVEEAPAADLSMFEPLRASAPAAEPAPVAAPVAEAAPSLDDLVFDAPATGEAPAAAESAAAETPSFEISFEPAPIETPAAEPVAEQPADPLAGFEIAEPAAVEVVDFTPAPSLVELPPVEVPEVAFGSTQVIRGETPLVEEISLDELPADFAIELGAPLEPQLPTEAPPQVEAIDFGSLEALSSSAAAPQEPEPATELPDFTPSAQAQLNAIEPVQVQPEPQPEPELDAPAVLAAADEQTKVIGGLRIGIPLYNVYLNEADEWSRRLAQELGEWALELTQPVPDSAVGLAHALAGSSATVGFQALSDIARALENSLQHAQTLAWGTPQHGKAFVEAAEEIRRLLHQFAAGFLKDPETKVTESLAALELLQLPKRPDLREGTPSELEAFEEEKATGFASTQVPEEPAETRAAQAATAFVPFEASTAAAQNVTTIRGTRDDDDIDVVDAIDPDLFPIFEEEAIELMPQLGGALREWAERGSAGAREQVLRVLHTLKGSARLAGALRLGEMSHRMESEIEGIPLEAGAQLLEPVIQRFDQLQTRFDILRGVATEEQVEEAGFAPQAPAAVAQPAVADSAPATPGAQPAAPVRALSVPAAAHHIAPRAAAGQAVRVRSTLLDRLMNQAGEVMITRSRLENELRNLRGSLNDLTGNLDRLRTQLRDIELQAETQMQSRLAQAKEVSASFDPLEFDRFTRVQELTRMMAESVNDVATVQRNLQRTVEATEDDLIAQARQTRDLQRDLLRTRMVEFEGISDRLYRVVRMASKESDKQVKLDITGGSIEMDRGVLDRMTPAFEHLLRNCVAHGIEAPAARTAAGKEAAGTILIDVRQEGNDVSVEFRDDGAGLNLPKIREKALQNGLITPEQQLTDADAANLIFTPGFSTAASVTELAGRGIGMDVVRSEVNALGGRIETSTQAGQGTSFRLVLPLTTAVTQVVMIRSGSLAIGVPANLVEIVRRAGTKEVQQAYNSGQYDFGGEPIPFFWSGALLQSSSRSNEPQSKTLPVVVFRSAAQRVAVHVDEVLGNQEVVVKNLGPQLARLPGLAGMTVLASGAVVLIYNPVALSAVYGEQARLLSADRAQPEVLEKTGGAAPVVPDLVTAAPQIPLVLVVDDSITVRRVTQRLLQREGYRVALASDGLHALEKLAEERPAVVLSDIEMPRMDGFDLARNIRADQRWADLPIVMITSRIAEKHREHARELGVNHYLGKPYSEEELLSLVKHYCSAAVPAA